jgi:uncharacterized protein
MIWEDLLFYVAVGFLAQMVDGAIGMAYGVTSTAVLLSSGVPPATASACVHAAQSFTCAASGLSHWRVGNVNFDLVKRLAIPGAIGGIIGALILTSVDGNTVKPFIAGYLMLMGLFILLRVFFPRRTDGQPPRYPGPLGFAGGFVDAIGGGGWGPVVTTTLIGHGTTPRYAIGSSNTAEFFVTIVISATFILTIGLELWPIIFGLVVGGVIAAPFAAYAARYLPPRLLMFLVGLVIIGFSLRTLLASFD